MSRLSIRIFLRNYSAKNPCWLSVSDEIHLNMMNGGADQARAATANTAMPLDPLAYWLVCQAGQSRGRDSDNPERRKWQPM
jgi:hypothetical protein